MENFQLPESSIQKYIDNYGIPECDKNTVAQRLRELRSNLEYIGDFINTKECFQRIVKDLQDGNRMFYWNMTEDEIHNQAIENILYRTAEDRLGQYNKGYITADEI